MTKEADLIAEFEQELDDRAMASYLKAIGGYSEAWRRGDFEKAVEYATEMLKISSSGPTLEAFRTQASDYLAAAKNAGDKSRG